MKKWKALSFDFLNLLCLTALAITQKWMRETHVLCIHHLAFQLSATVNLVSFSEHSF